jgi:hypothetical protein
MSNRRSENNHVQSLRRHPVDSVVEAGSGKDRVSSSVLVCRDGGCRRSTGCVCCAQHYFYALIARAEIRQTKSPAPFRNAVSLRLGASTVVRDANGPALAHIYFEYQPQRQMSMKRLSSDEARRIAANIAGPGARSIRSPAAAHPSSPAGRARAAPRPASQPRAGARLPFCGG